MADKLNSVKIHAVERGYHHGALREALIAAAEEVIAERGLDGFSLRETARRAGVSPAAPGHHFRDARGLLTAVAAKAFREFGDALASASDAGSPEAQIRAQGIAYVRFALAHPAKFDLLWRKALLDNSNPELIDAGDRAFAILDRAARPEQRPSAGTSDVALAPSIAAWSIVHGFAGLAREGVFGTEPGAREQAVEALLPRVLDHLRIGS
jgi:AcrR family transcriptional regulator